MSRKDPTVKALAVTNFRRPFFGLTNLGNTNEPGMGCPILAELE